jgi:hypothetical protein
MSTIPRSIFKRASALTWAGISRWRVGARTPGAWAAVVLARLKEFAPYAVIELLLPGGSVLALTLWFYRRRKKVPVFTRSLNAIP